MIYDIGYKIQHIRYIFIIYILNLLCFVVGLEQDVRVSVYHYLIRYKIYHNPIEDTFSLALCIGNKHKGGDGYGRSLS